MGTQLHFYPPDANSSVRVDVGVEKFRFEFHFRGIEWIVLGEGETGDEHAVLEVGPGGSGDGCLPLEKVVLCAGSSGYS